MEDFQSVARWPKFSKVHMAGILVGSMSRLAKNGLNYYAPILVETMTRMAGKVGPGVNMIPLLPIPVGGIGSETLIRDMMVLDSWTVHWIRAGHWPA